eukprot:SAG11_NODE_29739_length_307_cov_2.355769_1_plen_34_part_10
MERGEAVFYWVAKSLVNQEKTIEGEEVEGQWDMI